MVPGKVGTRKRSIKLLLGWGNVGMKKNKKKKIKKIKKSITLKEWRDSPHYYEIDA